VRFSAAVMLLFGAGRWTLDLFAEFNTISGDKLPSGNEEFSP
jgi:hypothetical protein